MPALGRGPAGGAAGATRYLSGRIFQALAGCEIAAPASAAAGEKACFKLEYLPEKIKHKIYRRAYKLYRRIGRPLPPGLQNIEEINFAAVKDYLPRTYSGDATLFLAGDLTADYDLHDGWRELIGGNITVHEIPGNHINIIKEPNVCTLAEKLREALARVTVSGES